MSLRSAAIQTGEGTLVPADAAAPGVAKHVLAAAASRNARIASERARRLLRICGSAAAIRSDVERCGTQSVLIMACLALSLVRMIGVDRARAAWSRRRAVARARSTFLVAVCDAYEWAVRDAPPIRSHNAARPCPSALDRRAGEAREWRCVGEIRRRCFAPVG